MNIVAELIMQAKQHPLDVNLEILNAAATRILALESALIMITEANSNWSMGVDDKDEEAIQSLIRQAVTD